MAMVTIVRMVSDAEIAALRADPDSIRQLDGRGDETFRTHYECSINYFVTGDAYPVDHPLASVLSGIDNVLTDRLEAGAFGVSHADRVRVLAEGLARVDVAAIRAAVASADFERLAEEDVDDAEILREAADPAGVLGAEIEALARFYAAAAAKGLGVVAFTT